MKIKTCHWMDATFTYQISIALTLSTLNWMDAFFTFHTPKVWILTEHKLLDGRHFYVYMYTNSARFLASDSEFYNINVKIDI